MSADNYHAIYEFGVLRGEFDSELCTQEEFDDCRWIRTATHQHLTESIYRLSASSIRLIGTLTVARRILHEYLVNRFEGPSKRGPYPPCYSAAVQ